MGVVADLVPDRDSLVVQLQTLGLNFLDSVLQSQVERELVLGLFHKKLAVRVLSRDGRQVVV